MEIGKLRGMVERAIIDGELSRQERDEIMETIYGKKQITQEECELMRTLQQKIWTAEIKIQG
ncbi:hypothetical protein [Dactylococcopsis salina]|uniref:Uncharacterized protein n=1 Tax=Dactylococcopsis salina (strain PCC 8305) TaxID=13035 RepID=K9YTF9_DACS8|nr:hypothetical protein [Dactylococcopsis salina]AFZ49650.1 hypothetical protein Dacsa_0918 [Dactylococcopsis salina PCC 8305]